MNQANVNSYLRTKILTASPDQLRLMLYDGAIKFCRQAKAAIQEQKFEDSCNNLLRAQKIVLELSTSLNHKLDPPLCGKLASLYNYIYHQLVEANMSRKIEAIDEAIRLIQYEQETWQLLMNKIADKGGPSPPDTHNALSHAQQTAISSLSQSV